MRKNFDLSKEVIQYMQEYKNQHPEIRSVTQALESIVLEHKEHSSENRMSQISDDIIKKVESKYESMFTRIRLGVRTADINSQIIIELLNTLLIHDKVPKFISTNTKHPVMVEAEFTVKERISNYKQRKSWNKKSGIK